VAALLFGGGYFYQFKSSNATVVAEAPASNVEEQISVLSDEEITNYLRMNSNISVYTNPGIDEYQSRNMDVQNMLENVSDEEIQQYLDQDQESLLAGEGI
jgi:hypothetical protein